MNEIQLLSDLGNLAVAFLFWASFLFPVATAIVWPWWKSWWGRNIASLEIAISLALLPSVLHREFGLPTDSYQYGWLVVAALFAAGIIVAWRGFMVFRVQWKHRKGDDHV